jgi:hypothetical protein
MSADNKNMSEQGWFFGKFAIFIILFILLVAMILNKNFDSL